MPKKTFYRLPKERQEEILQAAFEEFSSHSLQETAVGNITKKLGLSRASFYKYFDGLEEVYAYLYHRLAQDPHELLLEALREEKGHFFLGMERYAQKLTVHFFDPSHRDFYHNLMVKMDYHLFSRMEKSPETTKQDRISFMEELRAVIDWKEIAVSERELVAFLEFITEIFHELFMKAFLKDWSEEKILTIVQQRLRWLEKGIARS